MKSFDQFYTHPELARAFAAEIVGRWGDDHDVLFVEPAAGAGAFRDPLVGAGRKVRAIDIAPQAPGILQGDFLGLHDLFAGDHSAVVVIGNPPFGKNASMAVRFFNRAAIHADEIAFIVPRTFRKMSVQGRLHRNFHLSWDRDVPGDAFLLSGNPHDVPCAWQIWTRQPYERIMPPAPPVDHLIDYTTPGRASFAMRRVGFYTGRIVTQNISTLSRTTHYFMREVRYGVIDTLRSINWLDVTAQTAGVRSLSKREIAFRLSEIYNA